MPIETTNLLSGLQVEELSLVRRGANGKRIAITKEHAMEFAETVQEVLKTELEGEKELLAKLEKSGADKETQEAAVAQFRLLAGFKEKVSPEVFAEIAKSAKYTVEKSADGDDDAAKKAAEEKVAAEKVTMEKEHKEQLAELRKSNEEKDEKIKAQDTRLDKIEKAAKRTELVVRCEKEFPFVPCVTADEQADMILDQGDNKEGVARLEKSWKAASEAAEKSPLLKTLGSVPDGDANSSALAKVTKMAKERVEKSAGKLTEVVARAEIYRENPELAAEVNAGR